MSINVIITNYKCIIIVNECIISYLLYKVHVIMLIYIKTVICKKIWVKVVWFQRSNKYFLGVSIGNFQR